MKWRITIITFLFLTVILNISAQDSVPTNGNYTLKPPDFSKMPSYEETSSIVDKIVQSKPKVTSEYVDGLVRQIRQDNVPDEGKVFAIYLLGILRTTNAAAVQVLIDRLDLKAPRRDPASRLVRWGTFPAQRALARAGTPAVEGVLNSIPTESNGLRLHLMSAVLYDAVGKNTGIALVKRRLANELDLTKRANLESVLKELEYIRDNK